MNGDKEKRIIELAGDQEMMRLLNLATLNWEIAKNRVEQITQERGYFCNICTRQRPCSAK